MRLAVELQSHIFSFLVSEEYRGTLFACSKDPVLSSIANKHFYSDIVVDIPGNERGTSENLEAFPFSFNLDRLSKLVAENPLILIYVRVLRIEIQFQGPSEKLVVAQLLDQFAKTLLKFPLLSNIILYSSHTWHCLGSAVFLAALEDRLDLPTLRELHLLGGSEFPFSVLDDCKNIKKFSRSDHQKLLSLEIDLKSSPYYSHSHIPGRFENVKPPPKLSPFSLNLQRLIIHSRVWVDYDAMYTLDDLSSSLPAAAEVINMFISSPPRHLILNITISLNHYAHCIDDIDFSPLGVLEPASLLIPRIDLYIHTRRLPSDETYTDLWRCISQFKGIRRAINEDVLVIHSEEIAPVSRCMVEDLYGLEE